MKSRLRFAWDDGRGVLDYLLLMIAFVMSFIAVLVDGLPPEVRMLKM